MEPVRAAWHTGTLVRWPICCDHQSFDVCNAWTFATLCLHTRCSWQSKREAKNNYYGTHCSATKRQRRQCLVERGASPRPSEASEGDLWRNRVGLHKRYVGARFHLPRSGTRSRRQTSFLWAVLWADEIWSITGTQSRKLSGAWRPVLVKLICDRQRPCAILHEMAWTHAWRRKGQSPERLH